MIRLTASLLLFAAAPLAAQPHYITGEKDGVSFSYTSDVEPNGNLILRGDYLETGEPFMLKVAPNGHVEGSIGRDPVSFDVAPEPRKKAADELGAGDGSDRPSATAPATSGLSLR